MLTRREIVAGVLAVLLALAALLVGCASPRVPAALPHYPCAKQQDGRTVYVQCDVHEWLMQQGGRKSINAGITGRRSGA